MKRLLLLDNYDSFTYNLYHLLEKVCVDSQITVIRNDMLTLEEVADYDAIILSPGPGIPSEAGIMNKIIEAYKYKKPFLGICLGHQALAESFGYQLKNLKTVFHGVAGKILVQDKEDILFKGIPGTFQAGRYHSWAVDGPFTKDLKVTAVSEEGEIMAFSHMTYPIYGVQFHPESILSEFGEKMILNWYEKIR